MSKSYGGMKLNVEKIEKIIKRKNMSFTQFCYEIGCSHTWWAMTVKRGAIVSEAKAKLICRVLNVDLDYIADFIVENKHEKKPNEDQQMKEIADAVCRIEKAISDLSNVTGNEICRLQIQMRTLLKELGV